jgi:2-C-methyl-D-erythritol 4-phosphate cytidylyltransferase
MKRFMVYALIVAGGKGARLKSPQPKQYHLLAGVPILTRTLQAFGACERIDTIILVVPPADIAFCQKAILPSTGVTKGVCVVAGGSRRQDSVYNGLAAIGDDDSIVAIHDGVRPLVASETIAACVDAARVHGACIPGIPAWDTLKQVSLTGIVEATLPRERVWLAQTPQVFRTGIIRAAHEQARQAGFHGTDDACLVERLGQEVRIVLGRRRNIKITTPEDLAIAEALWLNPAPPEPVDTARPGA